MREKRGVRPEKPTTGPTGPVPTPPPSPARFQRERDSEAMEALATISQYGRDTLSGRADVPTDIKWLRDGIREMVHRADAILQEPGGADHE